MNCYTAKILAALLAFPDMDCVSAWNIDPLGWGIGVQN